MKKIIRQLAVKVIGKEITERFGAESPEIFKKIQYVGIILATISGALVAPGVVAPAFLVAHASNIAFVGATMVTIAKLAKKDNIQ